MDIRKRLSGWMALAVFATVGGVGGAMVAADPAFAKVDVDKLTIGGEIRVRYEIREGANLVSNPGWKSNVSNASSRARISVGYDLTPDVAFFAQIQDARNWGNEGNPSGDSVTGSSFNVPSGGSGIGAVSSANQGGTGVDMHQAFIQVKNVLVPGLGLKIGRQEIIYGDHRLFGNFGWSQVGNAFDAVKLTWNSDKVDLDLFWARISDLGACGSGNLPNDCNSVVNGSLSHLGVIFPPNGTGQSSTLTQDVYGAYMTLKPIANWTIEPYYFLLADHRDPTTFGIPDFNTLSVISPQAPDQTRNTLGGRINGKAGGLDFTAEGAYQFGSIASPANRVAGNSDADNHINAHAEAVKIGYTFGAVPMKPRIGIEFDYASGDNCVNKGGAGQAGCNGSIGNHVNTFDNLYPTNHFHYGYMDLMAWRNMVNYQINFDVKPSDVSKLQVNFILHRLARTNDNWYRAAQAPYVVTSASNQAASLGQELDIHYWHTFKEKFKFEIGYGHFFTGEIFNKTSNMTAINGCRLNGGTSSPFNVGCSGDAITNTNDFRDQDWAYIMTSILF